MDGLILTGNDFVSIVIAMSACVTVYSVFRGLSSKKQKTELDRREKEIRSFTTIEGQLANVMNSISKIELILDASSNNVANLISKTVVLETKVNNLQDKVDDQRKKCEAVLSRKEMLS